MRGVPRPAIDAGVTFATCISRVRDIPTRQRLASIRQDIENAATNYEGRARAQQLHSTPGMTAIGAVSGDEMVQTYNQRMVKQGSPGRSIYDRIKLLPENDICPFCAHREVSGLDHILPKSHYPIFAVTPDNLVACCDDCNKTKSSAIPTNASDMILHPYFENAEDHRWLFANVIQRETAVLRFRVENVQQWSPELNARIAHQFRLLDLATLYSKHAGVELGNIRHNLRMIHKSQGEIAVREELQAQFTSRREAHLNSWQTATYEALASSDWYWQGGFAVS